MMGGDGVEVKYEEVGSSMGGMARLRKVAASSWAGVSCARVSWARMLFGARVDGIGPFTSFAEFSRYWWLAQSSFRGSRP